MVQTDMFRLYNQPRLMVPIILVCIPTFFGPWSITGWLRTAALVGGCWDLCFSYLDF